MAKKTTSRSLTVISTTLCLMFALAAWNARAATVDIWWANNGTSTPNSGVWDNSTSNWVLSTNLTGTKVTFTNGATFPEFTAGGGTPISNITVTVNSAVACAGMGSGLTSSGDLVTNITLSGTGSIGIVTNNGTLLNGGYVQGIFCDSTGGNFTINVPLTGAAGIQQHGNGFIAFYASNSYAGGTALTGGQVVYYNNNNSFGTGPIYVGGTGNALVNGSTSALTITNNFTFPTAGYEINLASGNPVAGVPGTTWAGAFPLPIGTTTIETSSTATEQTQITGIISGSGGVNLTVSDVGILILAGSNTYDGVTTITGGTVQLASPENPGSYGPLGVPGSPFSSLILSGGKLQFTSSNTFDYSSRLSAASTAYNLDVNGQSVTFASAILGGAPLTNFSTIPGGMLTLSGANSYSGGTTITNSTVSINSIGDSGASSLGTGPVNLRNGKLIYTGTGDNTSRAFTGLSGETDTIDIPSGVTVNLSGQISGNGTWFINKVDTGTLELSGGANNNFLGMNVIGGTVILNASTSADSVSAINEATTVGNGATLQLSGGGGAEMSNTVSLTVSNGGVFDLNSQSDTIGGLTVSGSGISSGGALINSAASTTSTLTCPVALANNVTMGGSGNITLPGTVSGFGMSLTYSGSGILTLQGANTYSGGTTVTGGTLDINGSGAIAGNVTLTGSATLELDNNAALASVAILTLPGSPAASTVNLNYSGSETIGLLVFGSTTLPPGTYGVGASNPNNAFTGTGLLVISGNSYWDANHTDAGSSSSAAGGGSGNWDNSTSDWWVSGSSDIPWATDALAVFGGTAGTVTLAANVNADELTFTTANYMVTNTDGVSVLTLDGNAPAINVSAGNTTIECAIAESGANALNVNGPGTLTLSGANTYSGGTTLNNGATLNATSIADANSSIGPAGAVTIQGGGGTLTYTGAAPAATARTITMQLGTTTDYLNVPASAGPLTLSGQVHVITGNDSALPALTFTGGGTVNLGGTVDNSGLTMAINSGEVIITKTSTATVHGLGSGLNTVGTGTPGNSAELQLAGSGNYDLYTSCVLTINSTDGFLDLNGQSDSFSTLTLSGAGPTGAGALINSSATASTITNAGNAVVLAGNTTIGGAGKITLVSKVSGAYSLTYAGTSTLALTNLNTYTGGTTVNSGGTLQLVFGSLTNTGAGTGTITLNGNAVLNLSMTNTEINNVITGGTNSSIAIIMGSGNLWLSNSAANQLNNFSGTFNVSSTSSTGGQLVVGNGTNVIETINAAATWQIQSGVVVDFNGSQTNPAAVYLYGLPYTGAGDGALRLDASVQSGPVILMGNSEIGNGNAGVSTVSGPISGSFGFIKTGADPIVLTGTNTYAGLTTISNGTLTIGGSGSLGSGSYAGSISNFGTFIYNSSAAQTLAGVISGSGAFGNVGPGTLTLTATNTYTSPTTNAATGVLVIGGNGSLGGGTYSALINNSGSFIYNSTGNQTLSGVVFGTGTLTESGPGELTLNAAETYSGATSINSGGTLALTTSSSIASSPSLNISAGGIFDLSAYSLSFALGASTTLSAGGNGTNVGSTAATLKGGSSATINVAGPVTLDFTPVTFNGDTNHPALYVSQGSLNLNGSGITVTNKAATPLGAGTYTLIQVANNSVGVASTNVTVTGAGLAPGATASLAVSGGSLNLVVAITSVPVPGINHFSISGGNLIFSGTNGSANGTYYVLTSTNVALPFTSWTPIATNTFSGTGTFSVTNAIGGRIGFFAIEIP